MPDSEESTITLRDYYAGQALCGLLANPKFKWNLAPAFTPEEVVAIRALALADAMLIERQKRKEPTDG